MSEPQYNTSSEKDTVPREDLAKSDQNTTQNSGGSTGGGFFAGAVDSAKNAIGLNSQGELHQGKSLVNEAESQHDDVSQQPKHKATATTKDDSNDDSSKPDDVQDVPGLPSDKKETDKPDKKDTKADASSSKAKQTEDAVRQHNKSHGVKANDGRDLIDVALENDTSLKEFPAHKSGKKVTEDDEEEGNNKKSDDVQDVPFDAIDSKQNEFIRTGGKSGQLESST